MALASQSTRSDRSMNFSQRKGPPLAAILVVGGIAAIVAGYWLMNAEKSDATDPLLPASGSTLSSAVPGTGSAAQPATPQEPPTSALSAALAPRDERTQENAPSEPAAIVAPPSAAAEAPASAPQSTPAAAPEAAPATPPASPAAPQETRENGGAGNGFDATSTPTSAPATAGDSPASLVARGLASSASDPFAARTMLSKALLSGELSPADAKQASDALVKIGRQLTLTPVYNANDPTCFQYTIQSGDTLEKIVRKQKLGCEWQLVARMNNIKKPTAIRVGQRIKLPKGPFSAVVSKRDYRVDLCMGAGADRIVIASLPCGLGEANGTPTGRFRVRIGSKLLNPQWTHPVTGEHFAADDAKNPIGEHWLGLEGLDATNSQLAGYGMHGTIDIDSIGQDRSLGCVRLVAEDIAIVWECLGDGADVEIRN
jgi:nucleoid-associated protein YgaU